MSAIFTSLALLNQDSFDLMWKLKNKNEHVYGFAKRNLVYLILF